MGLGGVFFSIFSKNLLLVSSVDVMKGMKEETPVSIHSEVQN